MGWVVFHLLAYVTIATSSDDCNGMCGDSTICKESKCIVGDCLSNSSDRPMKVSVFRVMGNTIEKRAKQFGSNILVEKTGFSEQYEIIKVGVGDQQLDAFVMPAEWLVDFVNKDGLVDLSDWVKSDKNLEWGDIVTNVRQYGSRYGGKTYCVPLDGDLHLLFYRKDVFKKFKLDPPKTLEEYLEVAKKLNGKDFNGDGIPDFASCLHKDPNIIKSGLILYSFVAPYLQTRGISQGVFFDPDSFEPLIDNPGFKEALRLWKATSKYSDPKEREWKYPTARKMFANGTCAMTIDWGGAFSVAGKKGNNAYGNIGVTQVPGTRRVWDRKSKTLVNCTEELCPYWNQTEGINYAPYMAFTGWCGAVNKHSKMKEQAYKFLSFLSQPDQSGADITVGKSLMNPYRGKHFKNTKVWAEHNYSEAEAKEVMLESEKAFKHKNRVADLRIEHVWDYLQKTLNEVLYDILHDKVTVNQAARRIEKEWNSLTDEHGFEKQRKAYRNSLYLPPITTESEYEGPAKFSDSEQTAGVILTSIMAFWLVVNLMLVYIFRHNRQVKSKSTNMLYLLLVGLLVTAGACISLVLPQSPVTCSCTVWFINIGFDLAFNSILLKSYRLYHIFRSRQIKKRAITDMRLFGYIFLPVAYDIIVLVVNDFENPYTMNDKNACVSENSMPFLVLIVAPKAFLVIAAAFFTYKTRNIPHVFNESTLMSFSVYNIAACGLAVVVFKHHVKSNRLAAGLQMLVVYYLVTSISLANFAPKWVSIYRDSRTQQDRINHLVSKMNEKKFLEDNPLHSKRSVSQRKPSGPGSQIQHNSNWNFSQFVKFMKSEKNSRQDKISYALQSQELLQKKIEKCEKMMLTANADIKHFNVMSGNIEGIIFELEDDDAPKMQDCEDFAFHRKGNIHAEQSVCEMASSRISSVSREGNYSTKETLNVQQQQQVSSRVRKLSARSSAMESADEACSIKEPEHEASKELFSLESTSSKGPTDAPTEITLLHSQEPTSEDNPEQSPSPSPSPVIDVGPSPTEVSHVRLSI